jgi:hypothetical protein
MSFFRFCRLVESSTIGRNVRMSNWMFPTVESFHIVGLILVIGSIMWLDFRLLGFSSRKSVTKVSLEVMPFAWVGFIVSMSTGIILWTSEAAHLYINPAFRLKMLMLVMIGLNASFFELVTRRNVSHWDVDTRTPIAAKLSGLLSICLWIGVVVAGRWIAYAGSE